MKKAKTSGSFSDKTADIMSMIRNFTAKSEEKAQSNDNKNDANNNSSKKTAAAYPSPPTYDCNVYAGIIERHDKKVKAILKNIEKEKEKSGAKQQNKSAVKNKTKKTDNGGKIQTDNKNSGEEKILSE